MKMKIPILLIFVLAAFFVGGCNRQSRPEGMPKLHRAELTLTQEGKPLEGAVVVLHPLNRSLQRWGSGGKTDVAGKAVLYTLGKYEGVAEGTFKMTVIKKENEPLPPGLTPEKLEAFEAKRKSYNRVATVYSDPSTTPLEIRIGGGPFPQTYELGKAVYLEVK